LSEDGFPKVGHSLAKKENQEFKRKEERITSKRKVKMRSREDLLH
jgi:hypothetical protein